MINLTLRRLALELWRASMPPGPRLLLRDFLSFVADLPLPPRDRANPISAVAFSLSKSEVILDRGK